MTITEQLERIEKLHTKTATKDDLKDFPTKKDPKGFTTKDDLGRFATKDDLKDFPTKKDPKGFVTKDDLKDFPTQKDPKGFATKKDLEIFATKGDFYFLQTQIIGMREEMFTKKDYMDHMSGIEAMLEEVNEARYEREVSDHRYCLMGDRVHDHEKRITFLEKK